MTAREQPRDNSLVVLPTTNNRSFSKLLPRTIIHYFPTAIEVTVIDAYVPRSTNTYFWIVRNKRESDKPKRWRLLKIRRNLKFGSNSRVSVAIRKLRRVGQLDASYVRNRGRIYFAINRVGFNVGRDWLAPTERWHPLFLFPAGCILASEASPNRITMTRLYTRQGNRAALWILDDSDWMVARLKIRNASLSVLYVKYFLYRRLSGDICSPCAARDVDYVTV